ncbi:MAG TPA: class I SAM-dependent methyltransferase [Roseiflexaceae bacterium]|nr:class I SAM-dependent methyltransferase [Roseiflexaceae bacterium]
METQHSTLNTQNSALHEPLLPILRYVLATAGLPRGGLLLDLASGPGDKLPLLAEVCPDARLLALDIDRAALREIGSAQLKTQNSKLKTPLWVAADAQALPLRAGCLDAACCIAALGLFADRRAVLAELRRVLRPGGAALLVTSDQRWVELIPWPDELAAVVLAALRDDQEAWELLATEDVGGELTGALGGVGFVDVAVRAFLLDAGAPLRAELPLLPWADLRPRLDGRLDPATLARCDAVAREAEIELRPLVLVARAVGVQ